MREKSNLILLMAFLFVMPSFAQDDDCRLVVYKTNMREAIIKDSSICMVLDAALAQIRIEKVRGYDIPYCFQLNVEPIDKKSSNIVITVSNGYEYYEDKEDYLASKAMLLQYGGNQIILSAIDSNILKLFTMSGNNLNYSMYFLKGKEGEDMCGDLIVISQKVMFGWRPERLKNRFGFESYKYDLYDYKFYLPERNK